MRECLCLINEEGGEGRGRVKGIIGMMVQLNIRECIVYVGNKTLPGEQGAGIDNSIRIREIITCAYIPDPSRQSLDYVGTHV